MSKLLLSLLLLLACIAPASASHASKNSWQRDNIEVQIFLPESRYLAWVAGVNAWEEDSGISFNPVNMGEAACSGVPMRENKVRICVGEGDDCPLLTNSACTGFKMDRDNPHTIIGCKIWVIDPLFNGTVLSELLSTHEMGHCIGLNHNPDSSSVMCGSPGCLVAGNIITDHDRDAVHKLYGGSNANTGSTKARHQHRN